MDETKAIDFALDCLAVIVENYPWAEKEYKANCLEAAKVICEKYGKDINNHFEHLEK